MLLWGKEGQVFLELSTPHLALLLEDKNEESKRSVSDLHREVKGTTLGSLQHYLI